MITITDIFAGAGGSTSGAIMVPGVEVRVSANHWQLAVDVHQVNHPDTYHANPMPQFPPTPPPRPP
ncbi:MAG TPA: hypothetical protein VIT42_03560 [Microlunatus sp.]